MNPPQEKLFPTAFEERRVGISGGLVWIGSRITWYHLVATGPGADSGGLAVEAYIYVYICVFMCSFVCSFMSSSICPYSQHKQNRISSYTVQTLLGILHFIDTLFPPIQAAPECLAT